MIYQIMDIRHSGKKGPEGVSKEGHKYDERRNRFILVDVDTLNVGTPCVFDPLMITTPFVKFDTDDEYDYIRTENSIYVLRRCREDEDIPLYEDPTFFVK